MDLLDYKSKFLLKRESKIKNQICIILFCENTNLITYAFICKKKCIKRVPRTTFIQSIRSL